MRSPSWSGCGWWGGQPQRARWAARAGAAASAAGKLVGDKGYSFRSARRLLRRRGIGAVIPTKSDQRPSPSFDRVAYRGRNQVERSVGRLKQFRRIATRYDKRACNYLAWVTLATAVIWL